MCGAWVYLIDTPPLQKRNSGWVGVFCLRLDMSLFLHCHTSKTTYIIIALDEELLWEFDDSSLPLEIGSNALEGLSSNRTVERANNQSTPLQRERG